MDFNGLQNSNGQMVAYQVYESKKLVCLDYPLRSFGCDPKKEILGEGLDAYLEQETKKHMDKVLIF